MFHKVLKAYQHPEKKSCLYTGQGDPHVAKALGVALWDWTPAVTANVEPWFWNTHTMALAFGCDAVFTSEGKEWIKPLITEAEQVQDLEVPDVWSGRTGQILRRMGEMVQSLPEDTLVRLPDIQSPLGVAELMWDQSFYLALLTDPGVVHQLLEKITLFTISYINRITKELGPLFYHSCTWTDPYFENIEKLEGVRAINWSFGTSNDPAELIKRFSGKNLLIPHIDRGVHLEDGITKLKRGINSEYDLTLYLGHSPIFFNT